MPLLWLLPGDAGLGAPKQASEDESLCVIGWNPCSRLVSRNCVCHTGSPRWLACPPKHGAERLAASVRAPLERVQGDGRASAPGTPISGATHLLPHSQSNSEGLRSPQSMAFRLHGDQCVFTCPAAALDDVFDGHDVRRGASTRCRTRRRMVRCIHTGSAEDTFLCM